MRFTVDHLPGANRTTPAGATPTRWQPSLEPGRKLAKTRYPRHRMAWGVAQHSMAFRMASQSVSQHSAARQSQAGNAH
eukprot:8428275-Pyramimonas_sp.AAC.1